MWRKVSKLKSKGRIREGMDADLLILKKEFTIWGNVCWVDSMVSDSSVFGRHIRIEM